MLARLPWSPVYRAAAAPPRLSRARREFLRDRVADIMRAGDPTPFALEASCRHGIRSGLVLDGWRWAAADATAAEIVASALAIIGATRPTWMQGQPEYTQDGALPIEREHCIRCGKPLPEGHWRFCSSVCATAYNGARYQREHREEIYARVAARKAAWSAAQPERACEGCGTRFRPRTPGQRFCSARCGITFRA